MFLVGIIEGEVMKKMILSLWTVSALALTLQAYDNTDRKIDMQAMEASMSQIQKGFLYNNQKLVSQGVSNLKQSSNTVEVIQKSEMDYSPRFAKDQAEDIMKLANEIQEKMAAEKKHSAASSYTEVLNKCISCHNKIRKWNP